MVTFTPIKRPSLAGRPRVPIPPKLQAWLDQTYSSGTECTIAMPEHDVPDFLRLCRLHATHRGLTIAAYESLQDGAPALVFRMKDKRTYRKQATT